MSLRNQVHGHDHAGEGDGGGGKETWSLQSVKVDVSAYVPCYNNAATIRATVESIRAQTIPVDELFVVDDRSSDASRSIVQGLGVRVIRHEQNLGRGAVRARAMTEAAHELVLCCDATNELSPDFLEKALRWFDDPRTAAVYGRFRQRPARNAVERWRGRHLFMLDKSFAVTHQSVLITYGTLLRKASVEAVGGFNPLLKHSEDSDLGHRLTAASWDVVFDPSLQVISIAQNSLAQVLERYWRWYAGKDERVTWQGYLKQIAYSIKVMARQDLQAGDVLSVPISLFSPHYQFWKSRLRRF